MKFQLCFLTIAGCLAVLGQAADPTVKLTSSIGSIEVGAPLVAICQVSGLDSTKVDRYEVAYSLKVQENSTVLGKWTVKSNAPTFNATADNEAKFGLVLTAGPVNTTSLTFEANLILRTSSKPNNGQYGCSLQTFSSSNDTTGKSYPSTNVIARKDALFSAKLSLSTANNAKVTVGKPVTASCDIANGQKTVDLASEKNYAVTYYYYPKNGAAPTVIGQWVVSTNGTKRSDPTFSGPKTALPVLTIVHGTVTNQTFPAVITPSKVDAAGQYQCSVKADNTAEYFSEQVTLTVASGVSRLSVSFLAIAISIFAFFKSL